MSTNNETFSTETDTGTRKQMEIEEVDDFNFDGYQVVRGEFFAHMYEPSFSFNENKVFVNTACVKKLPDFDYVQILVNAEEKKLAIRPCDEAEKDSFRWSTSKNDKRLPKQITCRVFFAKVFSLMNWNSDYRYKLLGKLIRSRGELLFIFDLNNPEIFTRVIKEDGKIKKSRTPVYPEEWKSQFGLSVKEHQQNLQVDIFDGYAVFGIQNGNQQSESEEKKDEHSDSGTANSIN
jgi:hypothetical protein